jgi:microcystin-dependent protein
MKTILSYFLGISSVSLLVLHSAHANSTPSDLRDSMESLANEQINVNSKVLELEDRLSNLQRALAVNSSKTDLSKISAIPAGTVVAYAGEEIPNGWLLCDGRAISRNDFAKLFSAIKIAHGWGDNAATFNLPDYRGMFLRGVSHIKSEADLSSNNRTAMTVGGNAGNKVGSVQPDSFKEHGHGASGLSISSSSVSISGTATPNERNVSFSTSNDGEHNHSGIQRFTKGSSVTQDGTGYFMALENYIPPFFTGRTMDAGSHYHTGSIILPNYSFSTSASFSPSISGSISAVGDNETRPKNAYVNYIIKT